MSRGWRKFLPMTVARSFLRQIFRENLNDASREALNYTRVGAERVLNVRKEG